MNRCFDQRKEIVDYLVAAIERGTAPWQQDWNQMDMPQNAKFGYRYQGSNAIRLMIAQKKMPKFQNDPRWCTFKQANHAGWIVKKGEKAKAHTEYWVFEEKQKKTDTKTGTGIEEMVRLARPKVMLYPMFHASQLEGVPPFTAANSHQWNPVEKAEELIKKTGAKIEHLGDQPQYNVKTDTIYMPEKSLFHNKEGYYSTVLHELGHWTGHETRIDRKIVENYSNMNFRAKEELIAEICSMFVQPEVGLKLSEEHRQNQAAYVQHYINMLKKDPNDFFRAAAAAEKAADFILQHGRTQRHEVSQTQSAKNILGEGTINKVKELKLLCDTAPQNIKVYAAQTACTYKGDILHVDREITVQKVGKVSLIVHKSNAFSQSSQPKKGCRCTISYQPTGEKAKVKILSQTQSQELAKNKSRSRSLQIV